MANRYTLMASGGLITLLIVQTFHMIEHVAQVLQKFLLRQSEAHGLLGTIFDFEWVHFVFNGFLEFVVVLVLVWWRRAETNSLPLALRGAAGLQGYHVIEHVVRMFQYYVGAIAAPKGILGFVFPVIWLHFWINLIVLALIVVLVVGDWQPTDSYRHEPSVSPGKA
ncbi:MAG: hypothetical protein ACT4PY_01115 [Armatimonadota bacterium]